MSDSILPSCALLIVDLQRYYLDSSASFYAWTENRAPGALARIRDRVRSTVLPSLTRLTALFRGRNWPVAYLRLCGTAADRSDLHRHFRRAHERAAAEGFPDLYPLAGDPLAAVVPEVAPEPGDAVFEKTTFSGFASGGLAAWLKDLNVQVLVFTGLATSQCVDTTARDASDLGYGIIHIEDAQADYGPEEHCASLYASQGVCGGTILTSEEFCADPEAILREWALRELL